MLCYVNRRNAETIGSRCGEFAVAPSFRHSERLLLYCGVRKEEWQNDFFLGRVVRYRAGGVFGRDIVLACPIFAAKPHLYQADGGCAA